MAKTFKIGGKDVEIRLTIGTVENITQEITNATDDEGAYVRIIMTNILGISDEEYKGKDFEEMKDFVPIIKYATDLMNATK